MVGQRQVDALKTVEVEKDVLVCGCLWKMVTIAVSSRESIKQRDSLRIERDTMSAETDRLRPDLKGMEENVSFLSAAQRE